MTRAFPLLLGAAALLALLGCAGAGESPRAEELTQRQRDSAIAASQLPGAGAVGRALHAADSVNARIARSDSLYRAH